MRTLLRRPTSVSLRRPRRIITTRPMKTSTDICPPERRQAGLTERRRLKMAVPAHSYVRGSTLKFYEWLGVGKKKKNSEGFCLVDIKEAVPAEAPHSAKVPMPRDHAERVVEGARKLSPFLGQRMLAGHFSGTPAVLRELLPQDLKLEMDQLTREEAIGAARFLASVVGEAHAQQMKKDERGEWRT